MYCMVDMVDVLLLYGNYGCVCPQGHAAPALYAMWTETGFLKESELLSLCQVDSTLEGHPTPVSEHTLNSL